MEIRGFPIQSRRRYRGGPAQKQEGGQSGVRERRRKTRSYGGIQRDRLSLETPRDERQSSLGRSIQPMGIVDEDHQRQLLGGIAHQLVGRERDQKRVRLGSARQAE